jgi:hypothetical protein
MIIEYTVGAHASKEGALDDFESACNWNDYIPTEGDIRKACYVGYDFSLGINFDTKTGEFKVVEIDYGGEVYTLNKRD